MSRHLEYFRPDLQGHFLCPTCLNSFSKKRPQKVSEAHIIPKSAGGHLKSYLCVDCNSQFGAKQDKWFGEYFHLKRTGKSPLETRFPPTAFAIDGKIFRGKLFPHKHEIRVGLFENHNPPGSIDEMQRNIDKRASPPGSLEFCIPLLAHERYVQVGFLTAAYMMWFYSFGYSWVLQAHLDRIRKQILNPDERILDDLLVRPTKHVFFTEPQVGLGKVGCRTVPFCGIADMLVLLPAADQPEEIYALHDEIGYGEAFGFSHRTLELYNGRGYSVPLGLALEDRVLIWPDVLPDGARDGKVVYYPTLKSESQLMHFTDESEIEALQGKHETKTVEFKYCLRKVDTD